MLIGKIKICASRNFVEFLILCDEIDGGRCMCSRESDPLNRNEDIIL